MKASIARFDAHYEVAFTRPAFSRIGSFAQILEPIYDALSEELAIPSDAIKIETGDSVASAVVTVTLFSGNCVFEVRLDGYKAHFLNLITTDHMNNVKRYTKSFEDAVSGFLTDGQPASWKISVPYWLKIESGVDAAEHLIDRLTWLPGNHDPFGIGSTKTESRVHFECINTENLWAIGVTVEKSALPNTDLFYEISANYIPGSHFDNFDKKTEHIETLNGVIAKKLDLEIE